MGYAIWTDAREHGRSDFITTAVAPGTDALTAATVVLAVIAVVTTIAVAVRHRRQPSALGRGPDLAAPADNDVTWPERRADWQLRRMLAEARAQYDVWPSDYLAGVVAALHETVHDAPFVAGRRDDDQARNAVGRSASGRLRDYYLGRIAALAWMLGKRAEPPVQAILTEPAPPPRPHHDDEE